MIGGLWSAGCDGYCLASLCSNSLRKVVAARWLLRFCAAVLSVHANQASWPLFCRPVSIGIESRLFQCAPTSGGGRQRGVMGSTKLRSCVFIHTARGLQPRNATPTVQDNAKQLNNKCPWWHTLSSGSNAPRIPCPRLLAPTPPRMAPAPT